MKEILPDDKGVFTVPAELAGKDMTVIGNKTAIVDDGEVEIKFPLTRCDTGELVMKETEIDWERHGWQRKPDGRSPHIPCACGKSNDGAFQAVVIMNPETQIGRYEYVIHLAATREAA